LGPVIGALLVNFGKSTFTAIAPESWLFVLGGLFVFVTLFLPKGIVGTFDHGWRALRERRASADAEKGEGASMDDVQAVPNPAE
ncbi:MAG TPA: urea ABC transporter permease subunit UrtC, partial [Aurantimonas sp.]